MNAVMEATNEEGSLVSSIGQLRLEDCAERIQEASNSLKSCPGSILDSDQDTDIHKPEIKSISQRGGVIMGDSNYRMNNMEKLHNDMVLYILSRLPHQCIINCKLVCKPWRDLLRHCKLRLLFVAGVFNRKRLYHGGQQQFDEIDMNEHYSHKTLVEMGHPPSLPPDSFTNILASCNGLVCVLVLDQKTYIEEPIYIYNPDTQEHVYLPKYIFSDEDIRNRVNKHLETFFVCGFGYTYTTDEYKVVRIRQRFAQPAGESSHVQVYTLGSGLGWRDKERVYLDTTCQLGCCANGALHWVDDSKKKVMAFDLALEKFILFPLPLPLRLETRIHGSLTLKVIEGYLSLIHRNRDFVSLWVLKKKQKCDGYNIREQEFDDYWSWNKEFSISIPRDDIKLERNTYEPFAVTKKNQLLLWFNNVLSCYDPETEALTKLWDDSSITWWDAIPHFCSLVSLEGLGEKSNKRV